MKQFSHRKGYKTVSETLQVESMSSELRVSLWNFLLRTLFDSRFMSEGGSGRDIAEFSESFWDEYLKKPLDERPRHPGEVLRGIRSHFFACQWYQVYDFLEFVLSHYQDDAVLGDLLNEVLTRELSGYRAVGQTIVDVTDVQEVAMLQSALADAEYEGVTAHLESALQLLSKRENPDYRNSIKESICAVESMARIVANDKKATLGEALRALDKRTKLHPAEVVKPNETVPSAN